MGTRPRTKALKADQLKGELKGDLKRAKMIRKFQDKVHPENQRTNATPITSATTIVYIKICALI